MTCLSRLALFFTTLYAFFVMVHTVPISPNALDKRVTHTGQATWFAPGLGACGFTNGPNDKILAISAQIYGSGGNCNQWIAITNTATGKVAYGLTRDECESCAAGSLDLSPSLFEEFATLDQGVFPISWSFLPMGTAP